MWTARLSPKMLDMKLRKTQIAPSAALVIRHLEPADVEALRTLAQLDSSRVPAGETLVAQVGEELWAAISVEDFHAVADPFRPTGELVFVLTERARQLRRMRRRPSSRFVRLRPQFSA
jgi:hypothetical protein